MTLRSALDSNGYSLKQIVCFIEVTGRLQANEFTHTPELRIFNLPQHNHNVEKSSREDCFSCIENQKFTADEFRNETFMSIVVIATVQTRIEVHSILKPKILLVTSI